MRGGWIDRCWIAPFQIPMLSAEFDLDRRGLRRTENELCVATLDHHCPALCGTLRQQRYTARASLEDRQYGAVRPGSIATGGESHALTTGACRHEHVRQCARARIQFAIGQVLTGNLEPCARVKLGPLELNHRFGFGAYGSDHEDRYQLPGVAVKRALDHSGRQFAGKSVVIVGDSIHDVRCGRSLGVRAVAVATGRTTREVLAAEAPDALLDDFSDIEASLEAILGPA